VIDERVAAREHPQPGRAATDDLLDGLFDVVDPESDKRLGRKALRDELITLDMAGHETTANATRWAWLLLAQHPRSPSASIRPPTCS